MGTLFTKRQFYGGLFMSVKNQKAVLKKWENHLKREIKENKNATKIKS